MRDYAQFGVSSEVVQNIYNISLLLEYVDSEITRQNKIRMIESILNPIGFTLKLDDYRPSDHIFSRTDCSEKSAEAACQRIKNINVFHLFVMMMGMCRELAAPEKSQSKREKEFLNKLHELLNKNEKSEKPNGMMSSLKKLIGIGQKKESVE